MGVERREGEGLYVLVLIASGGHASYPAVYTIHVCMSMHESSNDS